MRRISFIAWFVLTLGVLAWVGVYYFADTISQEKGERAGILANAQQSSTLQAAAARTHSLVAGTVSERQALSGLFPTDVTSIAGAIAEAGKSAGVALQLSNAMPEASGAANSSGPSPVNAVDFDVEGQGSFASLMRALALLEALPIPTSIQRLDIGNTPSADGTTPTSLWHMSVSIRALTTALVSS